MTMEHTKWTIGTKMLKYDTKQCVLPILTDLKTTDPTNTLQEITLSANSFGVEACNALATYLATHKPHLRICNFGDIFTGRLRSEIPLALEAFTRAFLEAGVKLESLDLSDNAFGPDGLRPILPLIGQMTSLKVLRLNNTGLGPQGGQLLAQGLMDLHNNINSKSKGDTTNEEEAGSLSNLRVFVCGRSRLENGAMERLAEAFKAHGKLTEVIMPQDGIRPEGIVRLLDGLAGCGDLEHLDLQDNTFTEFGARGLAKNIHKWPKLRHLNVGDCMLSAVGSLALFETINALHSAEGSVPFFKDLEVLNLQYNEIDQKAALYLATILDKFPRLKKLEVNGNCFAEDSVAADAIKDALERLGKTDALGTMSDMEESDSEAEEDDEGGSDEEDADELAKELSEM
jgi:Ran GTPase-activating protein 1